MKNTTPKRKDPKVAISLVDGPWAGGSIMLTDAYGLYTGPLVIGGVVGRYVGKRNDRGTIKGTWETLK